MRYTGGKNGAGVYQAIINRIPAHRRYIEAFAGSAAVFRKKARASQSVLIELDSAQAAMLARHAAGSPDVTVLGADFFDWAGSRLAKCGDGIPSSTETMGDGDFVYLDPPYLHSTRKDANLYRCELTDEQHAHLVGSLLPAMSDRGVLWMLSGYDSQLYDDARRQHGWNVHQFQAMTRRGLATETLWMNYDPERSTIAESTYAGSDFRERERIRRKAKRWADNFAAMPAAERAAVLAAISDAVPEAKK